MMLLCAGGKVRRQELLGGFEQGRLVVSQDEAIIGALLIENLVDGFMLGMHAIELHHFSLEIQAVNEGPGGGDFVGLFVHGLDSQKLLAGLSDRIDQHHLGPADFLAVNDDGIGGGNRPQKLVLPLQEDFFDLIARHLLEHALEDRLAGHVRFGCIRVNPAAKRPTLQLGQPFGKAAHRPIALAHPRKTGQSDNRQHRRQFVALADGFTPLGNLFEALKETGHLLGLQSAKRRG